MTSAGTFTLTAVTTLPKDSDSQHIGRLAAAEFKAWCERHRVIFREVARDEDFGVDGELEISGAHVTGMLVKVQVKGSRQPRFSAEGTYTRTVKPSTMRYWAALPLNVVGILVDTDSRRMYWTQPLPMFDAASSHLVFRADHRFDANHDVFLDLLQHLAKIPATASALTHVQRYLYVYAHLRTDGIPGRYDLGTQVSRVDALLLESLYEHVICIRALVGLLDETPISVKAWRERNALLEDWLNAPSDSGLLDLIGGEMLAYLSPLYEEALAALRDMVRESNATFVPYAELSALVNSGRLAPAKLRAFFDNPWADDAGARWHERTEPQELRTAADHRRLTALLQELGCARIRLPVETPPPRQR